MDEMDFEEQLIDKLPHGSGINYDWNCDVNYEENVVVCSNAYDHMNDAGMYDIVLPFQVAFPLDHPMDFELSFIGNEEQNSFAEDEQLGEYLEDSIGCFLIVEEQDLETVFRDFSKTLAATKNTSKALKCDKNSSREITAYADHFRKYMAKHESFRKKLSDPKAIQMVDRIIAKTMKNEGFSKDRIIHAIEKASLYEGKTDKAEYAKDVYASRNQAVQTL